MPPNLEVIRYQTVLEVDALFSSNCEEEREINELVGRVASFRKAVPGSVGAVWPTTLDIKVIQGMLLYHEMSVEDEKGRSLAKYKNRNAFISRFILHATNVLRTRSQVSSRIQQLRNLTPDNRIRALIDAKSLKGITPLPDKLTVFERPNIEKDLFDEGLPIHYPTLIISACVYAFQRQRNGLPPALHIESTASQAIEICEPDWRPSTSGLGLTVHIISAASLSTYCHYEVTQKGKSINSFEGSLIPHGFAEEQQENMTRRRRRYRGSVMPEGLRNHDVISDWAVRQLVYPPFADVNEWTQPFAEITYTFNSLIGEFKAQMDIHSANPAMVPPMPRLTMDEGLHTFSYRKHVATRASRRPKLPRSPSKPIGDGMWKIEKYSVASSHPRNNENPDHSTQREPGNGISLRLQHFQDTSSFVNPEQRALMGILKPASITETFNELDVKLDIPNGQWVGNPPPPSLPKSSTAPIRRLALADLLHAEPVRREVSPEVAEILRPSSFSLTSAVWDK
ncbi:hypothetical protein MIND_01391500 [Mycena indigotica]|uniref:TEA domain-containing protein n=1 Tax=Mycena indigotica TaxID=2126181 RepID=A0A8H6RZ13_9AGAR|nr:uncharacterized protein MIND_01391500 [Mycena indigotica]KAF7289298.1 hypothetical protein MIND_01391500 [Mycena indigotica]